MRACFFVEVQRERVLLNYATSVRDEEHARALCAAYGWFHASFDLTEAVGAAKLEALAKNLPLCYEVPRLFFVSYPE